MPRLQALSRSGMTSSRFPVYLPQGGFQTVNASITSQEQCRILSPEEIAANSELYGEGNQDQEENNVNGGQEDPVVYDSDMGGLNVSESKNESKNDPEKKSTEKNEMVENKHKKVTAPKLEKTSFANLDYF